MKSLTPVTAEERIELLDVLRGFALFGILVVNLPMFSAPIHQFVAREEPWDGLVDRWVTLFVRLAAQGKFYTLFALLFGIGFAIQLSRSREGGRAPARFLARRMAGLLAIGLVHAFLIWFGDILVTYALMGFVLILFRNRSVKTLAVWAVVMLNVPLLITGLMVGAGALAQLVPAAREETARMIEEQVGDNRAAIDEAIAAYSSGGLRQIALQRARDVLFIWKVSLVYAWNVLGLFLAGMVVGRLRVFEELPRHLPRIRRWIWGLLLLGVALNLIAIVGERRAAPAFAADVWTLVSQLGHTFGAPALALFYASAILLLAQRPGWGRRLAPLAAVGRMALTHYLLQSLICTALFNGYGWRGLYGQLSPSAGLGLAVLLFLAQVRLSIAWLRRFRFGPVEWAWRSLTYGKLQPMRLPA